MTVAPRWPSAVGFIENCVGSHHVMSLRGWKGAVLVKGLGGGRTVWQPPAVQQVIDLPGERFLRGRVINAMIRNGALPGQGQLR